MVNRVYVHQGGLRVSKPGVDALSGSNADMLFTSDYSQLRTWMVGQVVAPSGGSVAINFGKTFTSVPVVDLAFSANGVWQYMFDYGQISSVYGFSLLTPSSMNLYAQGGTTTWWYTVWDFIT